MAAPIRRRIAIYVVALCALYAAWALKGRVITSTAFVKESAHIRSESFVAAHYPSLSADCGCVAWIDTDQKALSLLEVGVDGKLSPPRKIPFDFSSEDKYESGDFRWAPAGRAIILSGSKRVAIHDLASGFHQVIDKATLFGDMSSFLLTAVVVGPNASYLLTQDRSSGIAEKSAIFVWRLNGKTWQRNAKIEVSSTLAWLEQGEISPDGRFIALRDAGIKWYEIATGKPLPLTLGKNGTSYILEEPLYLAFADGGLAASGPNHLFWIDIEGKSPSVSIHSKLLSLSADPSGEKAWGSDWLGRLYEFERPLSKGIKVKTIDLRLDPHYRKVKFAEQKYTGKVSEEANSTYIMNFGVREDGDVLLLTGRKDPSSNAYLVNADLLDGARLSAIDGRIKALSAAYGNYGILAIAALLVLAELIAKMIRGARNARERKALEKERVAREAMAAKEAVAEKKAAAAAKKAATASEPARPIAGSTPGVILFGLSGKVPDQADGAAAISAFATQSGNAYLMTNDIPKILSALPSLPDDEAVVVDSYRRTAAREGWRQIRPICKVMSGPEGPRFGIAFPELADAVGSAAKADAAADTKAWTESDNRGTRQDSQGLASAYWMARVLATKKDPYLLYSFASEAEARAALLELPCIHAAGDSGKLICTEVIVFGCYPAGSGRCEAIVAGSDLSHDLWAEAKASFLKHGGEPKGEGELEPELGGAPSASAAKAGSADKVSFVREDRNEKGGSVYVYRIYKAPDAESAQAFLSENPVSERLYYLVVETPEGNYCRDIQGMYKE